MKKILLIQVVESFKQTTEVLKTSVVSAQIIDKVP